MKKNYFWMISIILIFSMTMVSLTSCSSDDDDNKGNQNNWTEAERRFAQEVCGTWVDTNIDEEGAYANYLVYDVKENGEFDLYSFAADCDEDEEPYGETVFSGTWKPLVNIVDRWANDGVLKGLEVTIPMPAEAQTSEEIFKDTLLIVKSSDNESISIWTSEMDYLVDYYNSLPAEELAKYNAAAVGTRGFWGWIGQRFINIGKAVINIYKIIAEPVRGIVRKIQGKDWRYASGLENWMDETYKGRNPRICDMSIPGTHDTFTYSDPLKDMRSWYKMHGANVIFGRRTTTQGLNIAYQWGAGVRSFDVRLDKGSKLVNGLPNNELGIYHGFVFLGISFTEGIDKIVEQLRAHKGETAIIILKFEGDESDDLYKQVYDKVEQLRSQGLVVDNPTPGIRLNQCKGKLLFIQRYKSNNYNLDVRASGWDDNSELIFKNGQKAPLYVQDLYESNGDELYYTFIERKCGVMKKCFEKAAASTDSTWFFNHSSAYHGMSMKKSWEWMKFADMNYAEVANDMNPWVADYVEKNYGKKTGVVVMDFGGVDELRAGGYFTRGTDAPINLVKNNSYINKE